MSSRIASLDLIRGVAILGILFMNIMAMAGPIESYYSPEWRQGLSLWELPLYQLQSLFFESRFMSMFSLLFGAGLYLQYQSAQQKGLLPLPRLRARLGWLLVFGLLHGFLLFVGDILALYAFSGLILLWLLNASNRQQLWLALLFLVIGQLLMLMLIGLVAVKGGEAMMMEPLPLSAEYLLAEQQRWTQYPDRLLAQAAEYGSQLMFMPLATIWHVLAVMLIGVVLFKKGFFTQASLWPWGALCLVLGWLLGLVILLLRTKLGFDSEAGFASMMLMMLAGLLSAMGYVSLLVAIAGSKSWLVRSLKNAGKMAFTLYIGQSLILYLAFVWVLPGLWGQLGRAELMSLALALSGLQLVFANYWLANFGQGPLERLWRRLAYGRAVD